MATLSATFVSKDGFISMDTSGLNKMFREIRTLFGNVLPKRLEQLLDGEIYITYINIRKDTPVDTGHARSRWRLEPDGASLAKNKKRVYLITNDAEYIRILEFGGYPKRRTPKVTSEGFSTQAPTGMVRINLLDLEVRLKLKMWEIIRGTIKL